MSRVRYLFLLSAIFFLAVVIRAVLLFTPGYGPDLYFIARWSAYLSTQGLTSFFSVFTGHQLSFPNYALYAPILWVIGKIYRLFSSDFIFDTVLLTALLKIPALVFDIATGALLYYFLKGRERSTALIITAAYLFNPALLYAGVFWGQVDTLAAFFVFLAFWMIAGERFSFGWCALVVAVLVKPQAIIFVPLFLLATVREKRWRGLWALLPCVIFIAAIVFLYFGFDVIRAGHEIVRTTERYPYLSMQALNIWFPFSLLYHGFVRDDSALFSVMTPRLVGALLFLGVYGIVGWLWWLTKRDRLALFFSGAMIAFAFFMLATQMHERYLFFFFPLAAPLLSSRTWRRVWGLLSFGFLLNLALVFPPIASFPPSAFLFFAVAGFCLYLVVFAWCLSFLLSSLHDKSLPRFADTQ
ncbi:DUF2029 domain-containing protein [Candidatus Uhrbacteria bacterium]|nr:DUF2029 domain-containing protein [Candidatus Uhrbacteria bacterium]